MDTFLQMQQELQSMLSVTSASTFYTPTRIKSALNRAKEWAEDEHPWPALEKAAVGSTEANYENYDYPDQFKTDSLTRITVNGQPHELKAFDDYLDWKLNNPTSTEKIASDYGRQYFIYPVPTTTTVENILLWGLVATPLLVEDIDMTIFSRNERTGNHAIVKKAFSLLVAKGKDKKLGQVVAYPDV